MRENISLHHKLSKRVILRKALAEVLAHSRLRGWLLQIVLLILKIDKLILLLFLVKLALEISFKRFDLLSLSLSYPISSIFE